jgi:hypothetical protein
MTGFVVTVGVAEMRLTSWDVIHQIDGDGRLFERPRGFGLQNDVRIVYDRINTQETERSDKDIRKGGSSGARSV